MNLHPAALMLPPMSDDEFAALKADIQEHGLRVPVVELKGQIVDGRHRARACEELGIDLLATELPKDAEPFAWVISANLHRRHLTTQQKAMVAARMAEAMKEPARQRKVEGGKKGGKIAGRGRDRDVANLPQAYSAEQNGKSREQAAALLGVSARSVGDAQTVLTKGSAQLVRMVDAGEVSVSKAAKVAREHEKTEQVEVIEEYKRPQTKTVLGDIDRISRIIQSAKKRWGDDERAAMRHFLTTTIRELK